MDRQWFVVSLKVAQTKETFQILHLVLELWSGTQGGCDVVESYLTARLTASVNLWPLAPLISVSDG